MVFSKGVMKKALILTVYFFLLLGCKVTPVNREIRTTDKIKGFSKDNPYMKAHTATGDLYILEMWWIQTEMNELQGYGKFLDTKRTIIEERLQDRLARDLPFNIPLNSIVLVETNQVGSSLLPAIVMMTAVTAGVGVFCLINPKACFGSCPTFYADNGDTLQVSAEGFSTSILPFLEATDVDMLYNAKYEQDFKLLVTNEAMETHSIRHVDILCAEKSNPNQRVFASVADRYYLTEQIESPTACTSQLGDCVDKVIQPDGKEYFSLSDDENLLTKEEIFVTFDNSETYDKGLIIGKRQSLMTTFLLYQSLAYMGKGASYFLSDLERDGAYPRTNVIDELGGIEIHQKIGGQWILIDEISEAGPIATDFNIIPLGTLENGSHDFKLVLTKGLWRIDYLALAGIVEETKIARIHPNRVEKVVGVEINPLEKLLATDKYLVTLPGDQYFLHYQLPYTHGEIFLESRGYYLEWIRDEWIADQNFRKLRYLVNHPRSYLKKMAKAYKKQEGTMEEAFWNSRYVY